MLFVIIDIIIVVLDSEPAVNSIERGGKDGNSVQVTRGTKPTLRESYTRVWGDNRNSQSPHAGRCRSPAPTGYQRQSKNINRKGKKEGEITKKK